jgi:hypothetical protein
MINSLLSRIIGVVDVYTIQYSSLAESVQTVLRGLGGTDLATHEDSRRSWHMTTALLHQSLTSVLRSAEWSFPSLPRARRFTFWDIATYLT